MKRIRRTEIATDDKALIRRIVEYEATPTGIIIDIVHIFDIQRRQNASEAVAFKGAVKTIMLTVCPSPKVCVRSA